MGQFKEFSQGIFFLALAGFLAAAVFGGATAYQDLTSLLERESEQRIALMQRLEKESDDFQTIVSEVGFFATAALMEEEYILSPSEAAEIRVRAIQNLEKAGFDRITTLLKALQDSKR